MLDFTLVIQAGGKSTRMGVDKAFVRVSDRPLIEDILEQTRGLGAETIIVTNQPDDYRYLGLPLVGDLLPDKGALGGLYTAIHAAAYPYALVIACDMPFVNRRLLDYMLALAPDFDAVVPRLNGEVEPFRAVYSKACLGPIRAALDAGKMRVISFFPDVRLRFLDEPEIERFDPEHLTFFNVNTPEDLERARELAREGRRTMDGERRTKDG
ncbi:MAG: molybdenum cofactor guanylyltransferase [Actinomycetota bacterium]